MEVSMKSWVSKSLIGALAVALVAVVFKNDRQQAIETSSNTNESIEVGEYSSSSTESVSRYTEASLSQSDSIELREGREEHQLVDEVRLSEDPLHQQFINEVNPEYRSHVRVLDTILDRGSEQDITFLFGLLNSKRPDNIGEDPWNRYHQIIVKYLVEEWSANDPAAEEQIWHLASISRNENVRMEVIKYALDFYRGDYTPHHITESLESMAVSENGPVGASAMSSLANLYLTNDYDKSSLESLVNQNLAKLSSADINVANSLQIGVMFEFDSVAAKARQLLEAFTQGDRQHDPVVYMLAISALTQTADANDRALIEAISSDENVEESIADIASLALNEL